MKFKIAVISLLTAIMMICGYTGYRLVQEAEKQTEIQTIQTRMNYIMYDYIAGESTGITGMKQSTIDTLHIEYANLVDLVGPKKGIIGTEPYEK